MRSQIHHGLVPRIMAGLVLGCCGVHASAQTLHDTDYLLRVMDDQLQTGVVGTGGQPTYPARIRSAVLGAEGIPNFTNDPGVDAELGVLIPGMFVGFDIVAAVRDWDAVTGFDAISADTVTVRKSGINTLSPTTDTVVDGIVFGQADLDASAGFHHHVQFILNPAGGGTPDGVWLFSWVFWTDEPGVADTDTLYIVFAQGDGADQIDDAVAWVEAELIGSPCPADLAEPFGVLDFFDVSAFLSAYGAQDDAADFAAPFGVWDFFDVSAFLSAYGAGCP